MGNGPRMRYVGNGFLVGIPSRDLSAEEVDRFGLEMLLGTGLYELIEESEPEIPDYEPDEDPEEA